jgi:hypothetical protein
MQVLTELEPIRDFKIRNRHPSTVIVFKIYSGITPVEICQVLGANGNWLPWDLWVCVKTRIDYNYADYKVDTSEYLLFYKIQGSILPPKVEIPNVLYIP